VTRLDEPRKIGGKAGVNLAQIETGPREKKADVGTVIQKQATDGGGQKKGNGYGKIWDGACLWWKVEGKEFSHTEEEESYKGRWAFSKRKLKEKERMGIIARVLGSQEVKGEGRG